MTPFYSISQKVLLFIVVHSKLPGTFNLVYHRSLCVTLMRLSRLISKQEIDDGE